MSSAETPPQPSSPQPEDQAAAQSPPPTAEDLHAESVAGVLAATSGAAEGFDVVEEDDSPFRRAGAEERELVKSLNSACRVARLHALDNSVTQDVLKEFATHLGAYLARPNVREVVIVQGEGRISVCGATIKKRRHRRSWVSDWIQFMERMGIGAMVFSGTWDLAACTTLLECFQSVRAADPDTRRQTVIEEAEERLRSTAELRVLSAAQAAELGGEGESDDLPPTQRAIFLYARLVALAEASLTSVRAGRSPDFQVRHLRATLMRLIESVRLGLFEVRLLALTALPHNAREPQASHLANVSILSMAMGRLLGLRRGHLIDLGFAAIYHDLGRGLLGTRAFWQHGGRALDESDEPTLWSVGCALRGRGFGSAGLLRLAVAQEVGRVTYTNAGAAGLRAPHVYSRVVAVAAAFDRACNGTPWTPPLGPTQALAQLQLERDYLSQMGGLLVDVLGKRPRGTLLRLPSKEVGIVIDGGVRRGQRCVVRVLYQASGKRAERRTLHEIDPGVGEALDPAGYEVDWPEALLA